MRTPFVSSDVIALLKARNSAARLTAPAPSEAQLEEMIRCALRSPDHAGLRPWRFVSIRGPRRQDFGEALLASLLRRKPGRRSGRARQSAQRAAARASARGGAGGDFRASQGARLGAAPVRGCAAFSVQLAAEALGYASIWRTGDYPADPELAPALGGKANEEIVALLYLGTRDAEPKPLPELRVPDFHRAW